MTQLIVALDMDLPLVLAPQLVADADVRFFKLNHLAMMSHSFLDTLDWMRKNDCHVFLDLKLYDTRDTVERIARQAFDLGARFLTVHATPSMLEAAMRAKPPGDYHKVLAVGKLTDGAGFTPNDRIIEKAEGFVCPVTTAKAARQLGYDGVIVCPGIRQRDQTNPFAPTETHIEKNHNHIIPAAPAEARAAGADYIVVGRPIYDAPDPVAVARAILEEIS